MCILNRHCGKCGANSERIEASPADSGRVIEVTDEMVLVSKTKLQEILALVQRTRKALRGELDE